MRPWIVAGAALLLCAGGAGAEDLKSGPAEGTDIPGAFHPKHATGPDVGKKVCLVCKHGDSPVVMIFAREPSDILMRLIRIIDAATVKNAPALMGSFVVFCNDDEEFFDRLKQVGKKADLKETILAVDAPEGPEKYNIAKEADVTVILYVRQEVKLNRAFKKGELNERAIAGIVDALPRILRDKGDK